MSILIKAFILIFKYSRKNKERRKYNMPAPLNLTGQRFGELIALRVAEKSESPNLKKRYWVCR